MEDEILTFFSFQLIAGSSKINELDDERRMANDVWQRRPRRESKVMADALFLVHLGVLFDRNMPLGASGSNFDREIHVGEIFFV